MAKERCSGRDRYWATFHIYPQRMLRASLDAGWPEIWTVAKGARAGATSNPTKTLCLILNYLLAEEFKSSPALSLGRLEKAHQLIPQVMLGRAASTSFEATLLPS